MYLSGFAFTWIVLLYSSFNLFISHDAHTFLFITSHELLNWSPFNLFIFMALKHSSWYLYYFSWLVYWRIYLSLLGLPSDGTQLSRACVSALNSSGPLAVVPELASRTCMFCEVEVQVFFLHLHIVSKIIQFFRCIRPPCYKSERY